MTTMPTSRTDIGSSVVVVIPYAGGERLLREQLDALSMQLDVWGFEVVIAVNRIDAVAEARGAADRSDISVRVVDATSMRGPSFARNVGWMSSSRPLVLFCDADDRCEPRWVAAMADGLLRAPLVRGPLDYSALNPVRFPFSRLDPDEHPTKFHHLPFGPSSNLGVRRELLERLGGFDERLLTGEDIDICWRAQYAGATLAHAPDAVVQYRLRQTIPAVFRQGVSYGRGGARLLELHRSRGARRGTRDVIRDLVLLGILGAVAVRGRADRLKLALEAGTLMGVLTAPPRRILLGHSDWKSRPIQGSSAERNSAYSAMNSDSKNSAGSFRNADITNPETR